MRKIKKKYPEISFEKALEKLKKAQLGLSSPIKEIISELGAIDPSYFQNKYKGGLELQQIPDELDQLSRALIQKYRGKKIDYLEVGVGSCATLIFFFQLFKDNDIDATLYGIDNLNHYNKGLLKNQKLRIKWCQENIGLNFYDTDTANIQFRKWMKSRLFDVILVDGDHSFEGCLWDFVQCVKSLKENGWIILHDITSDACPGVREVFELNKNIFSQYYVFSKSNTCGIGVMEGPFEYFELINNVLYSLIQKLKINTYSSRRKSAGSALFEKFRKLLK